MDTPKITEQEKKQILEYFSRIKVAASNIMQPDDEEKLLRITIPEDLSYGGLFDDLFTVYTKKAVLEQVKTASMGTMYQLLYRVELRRNADEKEFLDALRCRNGNLELSLGLVRREKNAL